MAEAGRKQDLYVGYKDLREYLQLLEEKGLLHRIKAAVDLRFEIGAIAARSLEQKGPALLFENIEGYEAMPLVANVISTTKQLAVAFNTEADEELIHQRVVRGMDARIPSIVLNTGPCKDVIIKAADVDIDMVPTPCWHEHDGGRYLGTTSGFVTRDPLTGDLNMGSYRVMIKDKQTLSMAGGLRGRQSTTGAGGGDHILDNEKNKIATPVAIVMGMDPLLTLASGSPVAPGKDHSMEYEAAGGWRAGSATRSRHHGPSVRSGTSSPTSVPPRLPSRPPRRVPRKELQRPGEASWRPTSPVPWRVNRPPSSSRTPSGSTRRRWRCCATSCAASTPSRSCSS